MTTHDELLTAVPEQTSADHLEIELDDVEGHGLKEVVVGLSAAAVLGGSAASAASLSSPVTHDLKTPGAVMAVVGAVQEDVTTLTAPTVAKVDKTTAKTAATATSAIGSTAKAAGEAVRTIDGLAADTINTVGGAVRDIAADPTGAVGKATAPTMTKAGDVLGTAGSAVDGVRDTAVGAAGKAASQAGYLAGYTLKVVDTVGDRVTGTAMDVVLGLDSTDVDAGAKAQAKDAWVVAKIGNEVVGSGQMDNGQVTVTIESRHYNSPITFTLGGHNDVAPITVHLSR